MAALITGASGGIGEEFARLLAANGHDVVLVARSAGKLEALAAELSRAHRVNTRVIAQELAAPDGAARVADQVAALGADIDILVNNAGIGLYGPFVDTPADIEAQMLQINIVALTTLTKRFLPAMVARRRGRLLNVASTAAFQPGPLMAVYYASKAYVLSFSEALSNETEGTGVTVTCLCPGPTRTGFEERAGLQESRLFRALGVMPASEVARAGYDGMMAGRAVVVTGLSNKVGVHALRVTPRSVVRRIVRRIQERK